MALICYSRFSYAGKVSGDQLICLENRFAPTEQESAIQNENVLLLLNLCACADLNAGPGTQVIEHFSCTATWLGTRRQLWLKLQLNSPSPNSTAFSRREFQLCDFHCFVNSCKEKRECLEVFES